MKFNELQKWQQEALKTISVAEKRGESRTKAVSYIVEQYADDIPAQNKRRSVRNFYEKNNGKIAIPSDSHVEDWKAEVVNQLQITPSKNGKTDWCTISEEVLKLYPEVFSSVKDPKSKMQKWVSKNKVLVDTLMQEATKTKVAASTKSSNGPVLTTAHVNDDDEETPMEDEVMPIQTNIVKMQYDKKTEAVSAELDMLIGRGDEKNLNDENFILSVLGYDPECFELVSVSVREGTWGAQSKDGDKLLSSRRVMANIKPRKDTLTVEAFANAFNVMVEDHTPAPVVKKIKKNGKNIVIVSVADLHLGKLAWKPETGENYDYNIAKDRFYYIINQAITKMKAYETIAPDEEIEEIIFFWSQDYFHFDTVDQTTTAGTRQDTDIRWQKLFYIGCEMLVNAIESLTSVAPVRTFYTRSNHDTMTSFYAMLYISAYFKDNVNVNVEQGPSGRKYIRYGVNLLGFGHGDKEGKRIASVMALEAPKEWGMTCSREFFLGHFHSRQTEKDESGVVVRYLASPTSTDAWHYESGYLGAQKQAQVFIRNKITGPAAEFPIPIPFDPNEE